MFAMTTAYSWQNSVSLCLSHFVTACYSRYFLTSYFCIQSHMMKRTSCFSFSFSFFNTSAWGIDLDYCDIEWLALETNRDHSAIFETAPKYCILDSFVDLLRLLHFF